MEEIGEEINKYHLGIIKKGLIIISSKRFSGIKVKILIIFFYVNICNSIHQQQKKKREFKGMHLKKQKCNQFKLLATTIKRKKKVLHLERERETLIYYKFN